MAILLVRLSGCRLQASGKRPIINKQIVAIGEPGGVAGSGANGTIEFEISDGLVAAGARASFTFQNQQPGE